MLPQLPSPGPFPILRARSCSASWHHWFGATRILWEEGQLPQTAQAFEGFHSCGCTVCAGCQLSFTSGKHSSPYEKTLSQKTGSIWKPVPGTQMSFVISSPSPLPGHAGHTRAPPAPSLLWLSLGGVNRNCFVYSLFSVLVVMPPLPSWWGWAATFAKGGMEQR